jgi:hypothetical protein
VQWMGCLLAVFVPYETARRLLQQLTGVELAVGTLWRWVQQVGQRVMVQLEGELGALAAGELPAVEPREAELEALPLVLDADGVRVPFRPHPRTVKGKTRWREIKVAILARLGARLTRQGTRVTRLCQRAGEWRCWARSTTWPRGCGWKRCAKGCARRCGWCGCRMVGGVCGACSSASSRRSGSPRF